MVTDFGRQDVLLTEHRTHLENLNNQGYEYTSNSFDIQRVRKAL